MTLLAHITGQTSFPAQTKTLLSLERLLVLLLLAIFSQLMVETSVNSKSITSRCGSLVVAVPCRDGLLIMADKRTKDAVRGIRDDATKIVAINSHALVASTGIPAFASAVVQNGKTLVTKPFFDANVEIAEWVDQGHDLLQLDQSSESLALAIESSFDNKFKGRPKLQVGLKRDLFQCIVFNYNAALHAFEYCRIRFDYLPGPQLGTPGAIHHQSPIAVVSNFDRWQAFGEDIFSVKNVAVLTQHQKSELLSDQILFGSEPGAVEIPAAKQRAAHVIKITSRSLPKDTPNPVGESVDVCLLTKDSCSFIRSKSVLDFDPDR